MSADREVCVVTHPLNRAGAVATGSLLEILSSIAVIRLITADLPANSDIRDQYNVVEITTAGVGETILESGIRFLFNQLRMCREIYRGQESMVLFYGATAYLLPVLFSRLIGRTVIIEPRGDVPLTLKLEWEESTPKIIASFLASVVRWLERLNFRLANAIITYTPSMADELCLEAYEQKLYTEGARYVDTARFRPMVPIEERGVQVGFLGRLDEEKGIRQLAAAVELLPTDVSFRFIGDGDLLEWLTEALNCETQEGRAELVGWVDHDEVPRELNNLRLLVMPSRPTEGLPTTILESLACGTPVLASPVSGIPDVVIDGETGYLMDSTDPEAIAADINDALTSGHLSQVSRNGRELVENEYSYEAAVNRYTRILEDIERKRCHRD